eukprot:366240-Chlamydomonas_euryale.AAC.2
MQRQGREDRADISGALRARPCRLERLSYTKQRSVNDSMHRDLKPRTAPQPLAARRRRGAARLSVRHTTGKCGCLQRGLDLPNARQLALRRNRLPGAAILIRGLQKAQIGGYVASWQLEAIRKR